MAVALKINETFAEAHNNLAYTLRKQGAKNYEEALKHYNRAIELKPLLPEPYMYRGVLFVQMGEQQLALKDHQKLLSLGSDLAGETRSDEKSRRQLWNRTERKNSSACWPA